LLTIRGEIEVGEMRVAGKSAEKSEVDEDKAGQPPEEAETDRG
jgi:hypothetical protein